MTNNYQARFSDGLPYVGALLQVKNVKAIDILGIERLKGENARLLQRLECHRFSVDEAGDIHNLYEVSPVVQDKLFQKRR
jgi:hypothetical protein